MQTKNFVKTLLLMLAFVSSIAFLSPSGALAQAPPPSKISHVLILGIDGLHAFDLENYVQSHPTSALAQLKRNGITYLNASTSKPSDSFPGILAIVTGGSPFSTGVYYETGYDRQLSPAGSQCAIKGTELALDESIDVNPDAIDGGGLDPKKLPLDSSRGCAPVYPHDLLRVNTIFEVIHSAGLRTAWADKQPSYEIVTGPSGHGVDDLFVPELHANRSSKSLEKIEAFDDLRLQAILNEIAGKDHAGEHSAPVPAVFGMTFQAITVGQKLRAGMGYLDAMGTPSAALASALDYTDKSLATILEALRAQNLISSTVVILTAKHGQTPVDPTRVRIVDQKLIPGILNSLGKDLIAECSGDDVLLLWLRDPSRTPEAVAVLSAHQPDAHISRIYSGASLRLLFPDPKMDSRAPDIVVEPELGVIYTNPSSSAIAEHGSFQDLDTHVPLLVSNPAFAAREIHTAVQTTQIAPTVLRLLNLDPRKLQAVQMEDTQLLPGFPY